MTTTAPASVEVGHTNEYYRTQEEFVFALADALKVEYEAIAAAGFQVQIDDAWLAALWDRIGIAMGLEAYKRYCMMRVEALNHALAGVPEDQVRYHLCWGSWHGPHLYDIPLADIVDVMLAVNAQTAGPNFQAIQVQLLVWIFVMRIMMVVASAGSYFINEVMAKARYGRAGEMNFERPLTNLVIITSAVSIILTFVVSYLMIPDLGGNTDLWWQLSIIISCGTAAGAVSPRLSDRLVQRSDTGLVAGLDAGLDAAPAERGWRMAQSSSTG